jgi:hypothetical protein
MWDVTCEHARRELRQAEEMGEATDWKGYIPVGGELLPPDDEPGVNDDAPLAVANGPGTDSMVFSQPGSARKTRP